MFYSKDGLFMVKTVSKSEADSLHTISQAYYNHLEMNPNSLLVRFFGSHSLRCAVFISYD
jgi:1-phosphatidylinositol-4-phosphate 5-kinase